MNMKKSIAGIMAGAMAVSAMAAVVSADEGAISLTYDLKTYKNDNNKTKAKVTVVANYEGSLISKESMKAGYVSFGANNGFVTGSNIYTSNGVLVGKAEKVAPMKEFEFTARPYKDVITGVEEKYQTYKATGDAKNVDGAFYRKDLDNGNIQVFNMPIEIGTDVYGAFDLNKYDIYALGYSTTDGKDGKPSSAEAAGIDKLIGGKYEDIVKVTTEVKYYMLGSEGEKVYVNANANDLTKVADGEYTMKIADKGTTVKVYEEVIKHEEITGKKYVAPEGGIQPNTYAVRDAVAKMTYEIPNTIQLNKANGWGWDYSYNKGNFTEAEMEHIFQDFFNASLYGDVTMSAEVFAKGFWTDKAGVKKGLVTSDTTLVSDPTTVAIGAFTAGASEEAVIPFKTTLNPSLTTDKYPSGYVKATGNNENDVIAALRSRKAGGNFYTKPIAVINDAIANHTNVTFTFTSYDGYVGTTKSQIANQWVNADYGYSYRTSDHDWHNPTFGQHLYTNIKDSYSLFDSDDYDMEGSYRDPDENLAYGATNWGFNLFTGAVVVNNQITMQLSDVDTFNWGSNTLTFDWFDITDDGRITDAKTFLTSMLLYTPVDWYWDKLTVVVTDEEREDIDAGAGLEDEAEVIEDEPEVEDPEIVEDPEVVETEAETEAAPVETAPSPATGNAPVALAVIPVALAAAAVVAKKRG